MKTLSFLVTVLILLSFAGCTEKEKDKLKVITFNIRYDNPGDGINAWPGRAGLVCDFLKTEKPDLFGLQEALWYQYEDVDSALSGYSSVAAGRDDGKRRGEMNPAFYNVNRFDFVRSKTFWLSETPEKPGSKGWGASLPRIVSWVELKDKVTKESLFYFNTHFAHDSDSARVMSSAILLSEVKKIAGKSNFVITGDFNMIPQSRAYSILTEEDRSRPFLVDTYIISKTAPEGPEQTFNGWSDRQEGRRIDYIFARNGVKVYNISTLAIKEGSVFISDHWPVRAVISLN